MKRNAQSAINHSAYHAVNKNIQSTINNNTCNTVKKIIAGLFLVIFFAGFTTDLQGAGLKQLTTQLTAFEAEIAALEAELLGTIAIKPKQTPSAATEATAQKKIFDNLLVTLATIKDSFKAQLLIANVLTQAKTGQDASEDQITVSNPTVQLKGSAESYLVAYTGMTNFLSKNASFNNFLAPLVMVGYKEFSLYAQAVLNATPVVVVPIVVAPGVPLVGNSKADQFIQKNFGDATLEKMSISKMTSLVKQFNKIYKSSDSAYYVYQMWAVYVPARYWELQYLKNSSAKISTTLQSKFDAAFQAYFATYNQLQNKLPKPYGQECSELLQEFQLVADSLSLSAAA